MTNWFESTQNMMQMWMSTQQQMMQNMMEMSQAAMQTGSSDSTPAPNPADNMMQMWRSMMRPWTNNMTPVARDVSDRMMSGQAMGLRLMELTMQTWQQMMPIMQEGGDWQQALTRQMQTIQQDITASVTGGLKMGNNMADLWQTYMEQWQMFMGPWMNASTQGAPHMMNAMMGDGDAMMELSNLYWNAYEDSAGKLLQMPSLGYTREMDEKMRRGFAAWLDVQQVSYEYQVMLADAWTHAFEKMMRQMLEAAEQGEQIDSVRTFLNQWSNTADSVFLEVFRSDDYIELQGKLVNTMMAYRQQQREISEEMLRVLDLPTRSEIDEAHRRIYELRREIKSLKKQVAALQPDAKPKKKKTTRRRKKKTESESE